MSETNGIESCELKAAECERIAAALPSEDDSFRRTVPFAVLLFVGKLAPRLCARNITYATSTDTLGHEPFWRGPAPLSA
jgi:hypothetical protein